MITDQRVDQIVFYSVKRASDASIGSIGSMAYQRPMIVVCAWCADGSARTTAAIAAGCDVTHGICPACLAEFDRRR